MAKQATVQTTAKIDISPDGVRIAFEGIDTELAQLIASAVDYVAEPAVFSSYDTHDVIIKSKKILQFVDAPTS